MKRSLQIKAALVVVLSIWALVSLWPTIRLSRMSPQKYTEMSATPEGVAKLDHLHARAIKRGLDLQGGMYLVLDIDTKSVEQGTSEDAVKRTLEILRNRIDQFGVSEPDVRQEGNSRIIVQLPGLQDAERAKRLIGRTARMEFRMVREGAEVTSLIARLDKALTGKAVAEEALKADDEELEDAATDSTAGQSSQTAQAETDSSQGDLLSDLGGETTEESAEPQDWMSEHPLSALMGPFLKNRGAFPVSDGNRPGVDKLLHSSEAQRLIPRDVEFLWGSEKLTGNDGSPASLLYLVDKKIELTGGEIRNAGVSPDPDRPPLLMVNLGLSKRGGLKFANVTGANVGRKLGIVLDGVVISAPNIRTRIPNGQAVISGGFAADTEARDLALMLRAGALPVDVHIAEERTVGPSLGKDSIHRGVNAALIGGLIVVLFIIVYYRAAGVVAAVGLFLTLLLLMGVLAQLHLTLALPGTIIDANITTFIAAVVLYYFGTGPIRGFAVTLSIGILTSMFSALIFSHTVYDFWLVGRNPRKLSI